MPKNDAVAILVHGPGATRHAAELLDHYGMTRAVDVLSGLEPGDLILVEELPSSEQWSIYSRALIDAQPSDPTERNTTANVAIIPLADALEAANRQVEGDTIEDEPAA